MSYHGLSGLKDTAGFILVADKLEQWEWYQRFIEMNPDLQERWEQHKTYEILNNEHRTR